MSLCSQNKVVEHFIRDRNAAVLLNEHYNNCRDEREKHEFVLALIAYAVAQYQMRGVWHESLR